MAFKQRFNNGKYHSEAKGRPQPRFYSLRFPSLKICHNKKREIMERVLNIKTNNYLGKKVKVAGWVNSVRSHGKIIFVDLRDRSGILCLIMKKFTKKQKNFGRNG
jgi:lysyl-tRNA synthetase class II